MIKDIKRGTVVRALKDLDPEGAKVQKGQLGVVFGDANCYGDGAGPIVRWFTGFLDPKKEGSPTGPTTIISAFTARVEDSGVCNVYEGWVEVVHEPDIREDTPPPDTIEALKKLLHYSLRDIDYEYSGLTAKEKSVITREQYALLVDWIGEDRKG